MRIAIALSGGRVRAAAFHCGVLRRLALDELLERTTFVSTVSGGSLLTGLILCQNFYRWPTSEEFLETVLPQVSKCLTTATLQWSYVWRVFALPWRLAQGRAWVLARQLEAQWGIVGSLQDVPSVPRWIINATCYETGKNWRFSQPRMGDYLSHYVVVMSYMSDSHRRTPAIPQSDSRRSIARTILRIATPTGGCIASNASRFGADRSSTNIATARQWTARVGQGKLSARSQYNLQLTTNTGAHSS